MKFVIKYFLIIFCVININFSKSQNLVPNPSFELNSFCPSTTGQLQLSNSWISPTWGSSDYFNTCATVASVSSPLNYVGFSYPKVGNSYVGIVAYCNSGCITSNSREYIQIKLTSPLKLNTKYCLEYFVSLADSSQYSISNLGAYFHIDTLFRPSFDTISISPQVESSFQLNDTAGWMQIKSDFWSTGGERYLTIGNFKDNSNTNFQFFQPIYTTNLERFAYYYIDEVSLVECDENPSIPNVFSPNGDEINDLFRIENLPPQSAVIIYNRWGIKVFESKNNNTFWDGKTTSGIDCTEGAYFYLIQTEKENYKGYLQLIR